MKKYRFILATALAIVMVFTLASCGSSDNGSSSETGATKENPVVLKIASQSAEGSHEIETLEQFASIVKEKTDGAIDVQVFPSGQLGALPDTIEGVSMGTIEMVSCGLTNLQQICPSFAAYDMWLYEDAQDVIDVYNSDLGKKLNQDIIDTAGVRVLSYNNCSSGRMYLWSNKPIETMGDLDGQIIRVPSNKSISTALGALGSTSVIGFGDMYTAAQTGVIDIGSADISTIIGAGYDEVFKYCDEMTNNFMAMSLVISEKAFSSLSAEQQQILQDAATETCTQWDDKQDELNEEMMDLLDKSNSKLVTMKPAELEKMDELIHEAIDKYLTETIDADTISQVRDITSKN